MAVRYDRRQAGEQYEHRILLQSAGIGLEKLIGGVADISKSTRKS
jgi:hypothetical protein